MDIGGTQHPNHAQIMAVAEQQGIKATQAEGIIEQVRDALAQWPSLAQEYAIAKDLNKTITQAMKLIDNAQ
jgi:hypothetical protein